MPLPHPRTRPFRRAFFAAFSLLLFSCQFFSPPSDTPPASEAPVFTLPNDTQAVTETSPYAITDTSPPPPTQTTAPLGSPGIPDPAGFFWQVVATGFNRPVDAVHAGDGSGRLFIVEQRGVIHILREGSVFPIPYLDIRDRVGSFANEQGLLGLAFHPRYEENGFFYVNYTDENGDTSISRFQVTADRNRADPASEFRLLHVRQPFANHNGGGLAFGPDGYLYIALGDGGSAGDPQGNGQSLDTHLGKILRVDVDGGSPYAIPPDNPFANGGGLPEIWLYGLRNPWRISFDRATDDLYIGDVGQGDWEEINFLPADSPGGANFGWVYFEGNHTYEGNPPANLNLLFPVAEYDHNNGNCSVTGGFVYRGPSLPEWQGVYLYADFCSGLVWGLARDAAGTWQNRLVFSIPALVSSFGEDEQGEIYLLAFDGNVYRLTRR